MLPNTPIVATGSIALSKAPVAKHSAPDNAITPLLEAANKKEPISNATHKVPGIANNNILQKNEKSINVYKYIVVNSSVKVCKSVQICITLKKDLFGCFTIEENATKTMK